MHVWGVAGQHAGAGRVAQGAGCHCSHQVTMRIMAQRVYRIDSTSALVHLAENMMLRRWTQRYPSHRGVAVLLPASSLAMVSCRHGALKDCVVDVLAAEAGMSAASPFPVAMHCTSSRLQNHVMPQAMHLWTERTASVVQRCTHTRALLPGVHLHELSA
jgi:hypothetical protein